MKKKKGRSRAPRPGAPFSADLLAAGRVPDFTTLHSLLFFAVFLARSHRRGGWSRTSGVTAFGLWGRVLTDGGELPASRVQVVDGRIVRVEPAARPQPDDTVVEDGWIAPGLIDLQVNGAGGADLTSASDRQAALGQVARTLARHGVTGFCPTIVSAPTEVILDALAAYGAQALPAGAEALGLHIEGPFIAPEHRGIHEPAVLRSASPEELRRWLTVGQPAIVTLAPERPGALEAIAMLSAAGVVVSLGHSGAGAQEARAGLDAGARMATHLFNGMPPLHHRRPGLVGALLASSAVLGLIVDGIHVDPLVVDLVVNRAGPERVALVSDALAAAGAPPGASVLGNQSVVSDGQVVRRADGHPGRLRSTARRGLAQRAHLAAGAAAWQTRRYGHPYACPPARTQPQGPGRRRVRCGPDRA